MTNTPSRISSLASSLAEAIMQMAEHDRGIIKSKLEELIFQHCAAADAIYFEPFVPGPVHYVQLDRLGNVASINLEPGSLNYVPEAVSETSPFPPAPNMTATEVRERWHNHILSLQRLFDP